jgi:hypothetical protein
LVQELRHHSEFGIDPLPQDSVGNATKLSTHIAHDPTRVALQLLQRFAHTVELLGMSVSTNLQRHPGCKPGIGLPKSSQLSCASFTN